MWRVRAGAEVSWRAAAQDDGGHPVRPPGNVELAQAQSCGASASGGLPLAAAVAKRLTMRGQAQADVFTAPWGACVPLAASCTPASPAIMATSSRGWIGLARYLLKPRLSAR